jgi:putative membrane protein
MLVKRTLCAFGVVALGAVWFGPLPARSSHSFAAHMTVHMTVVAIAAPLIALSLSRTKFDPAARWPRQFAPLQASIVELIVVWAWHAPGLHEAARQNIPVFWLEQGSFLATGLFLWFAAVGGGSDRPMRQGPGIVGLLFTSMHMTLLGALLALASRPLYSPHAAVASASAVADQQMGGVIMLLVGSVSYLAGGLWLTLETLRAPAATIRHDAQAGGRLDCETGIGP